MKEVQSIYDDLQTDNFIDEQFNEIHWNKNILFTNLSMSGRNFYRYILPYTVLFEYDVCSTALLGLEKFSEHKQYMELDTRLNSRQILWADYIVIPFTPKPLIDVYSRIKQINPDISIIFNVDFNYYRLSSSHPYYEMFGTDDAIDSIEDNIFYSDIMLTTNTKLAEFILDKFKNDLNKTKYNGINSLVEIGCFPILIDEQVVLENLEILEGEGEEHLIERFYDDLLDSPLSDSLDLFYDDMVGIEDNNIVIKRTKSKASSNGSFTEKEQNEIKDYLSDYYSSERNKTFVGSYDKYYVSDKDVIIKKKEEKKEEETKDKKKEEKKEEELSPLRVGIIASDCSWEDINSYKEQIKSINGEMKDKVQFVCFGFNGLNEEGKSCFPENTNVEYVKPCSIIHYFKQLRKLELDFVFIPLRKNDFNITSENYNKYIEASLFSIPVIVCDIFPYNEMQKNNNIIILQKKADLIEVLKNNYDKRENIKLIGDNANKMVKENFVYHEDNIPLVDNIFEHS